MKTLLKLLLGLLLFVAVVVVAAVIILPRVIDPNDYRPQIAKAVEDATGRQLAIPGQIELSVFPWLGLRLGHLELSNAPGFGDEPFAAIDGASIRVKVLPLLSRRLEVDKILLDGLRANLAVRADGKTNWDDLAGDTPAQQEPASQGGQIALAGIALGGIEVSNASIHYQDAASKLDLNLSPLSITAGTLFDGTATPIELTTQFTSTEPAVKGSLTFSGKLTADTDAQQYALRDLSITLNANGTTLPGGKVALAVDGDLLADLKADQLTLSKLAVRAMDVKLKGNGTVTQLTKDPQVQAKLQIETFNPRQLLAKLAVDLAPPADDKALTEFGGSLALAVTSDSAQISPLRLQLDDTTLTGELKITHFAAPAIHFTLSIDAINADRYLPASEESPAGKPAGQPTGGATAQPVNLVQALAGIATLNARGSANIGKLQVANLHLQDISATLKASNGNLNLDPLRAKLYDGSYNGKLRIALGKRKVTLRTTNALAGVQLGPLVKDVADLDLISGVAQIDSSLTAAGATSDDLLKTLDGKLGFEVTDGLLKNINIDRSVCQARAQIKGLQGKQAEACDASPDTRFTAMRASAVITKGVLRNNDLFIEQLRKGDNKFLHITGAGTVDLPNSRIDYRVKAGKVEKQADGTMKPRGTVIPVRITGTFENIKVLPDVAEAAKAEVKKKVQNKLLKKLAPKADDSPGDALKKQLLRGLFGG